MWTVTVNARVFFCWHDLTVTVSLPSDIGVEGLSGFSTYKCPQSLDDDILNVAT